MISTGILNIFLECPFCCRTACPPSVWLISLGFPSCWSLCSPSCWLLCPPGLPSYLPLVSDLIFLLVDLVSPLFLFFIPSYFPSCWSLCPPCLPSVSLCLRSCLKVPTTPFHSDDANDADCISCITTLKNHLQHNLKKTFPRRTLLPQHVPNLRVPFPGHPPTNYSLRSPNTTPLAPSTKAGFRNFRSFYIFYILQWKIYIIPEKGGGRKPVVFLTAAAGLRSGHKTQNHRDIES